MQLCQSIIVMHGVTKYITTAQLSGILHSAECRSNKCGGAWQCILLSVVTPNVVLLNVVALRKSFFKVIILTYPEKIKSHVMAVLILSDGDEN
jgi:hypothetical protein